MSAVAHTDGSGIDIETKADAESQIKEGDGVMADGTRVHTEGEGRGTRYFVGGDNVPKADAVAAVVEADGVTEVGADDDNDDEVEARDRDGAVRFARETFAGNDYSFGADEGDAVLSLVTGEEMGYITGSHVKASPAPVDTVDGYRALVVEAIDVVDDEDEVPIAPDALMEEFRSYGGLSDETRDELAEINRARWEAGEYDHLRKDDGDDE